MASKVKPKKVNLTELFYDLVFVFSISKITEILRELNKHNFIEILLLFSILLIVFINTWMVQTVYTNRYGRNSILNILFFMIDMCIILFMSTNLDGKISGWFRPIALAAGVLSFTLVLQYLVAFIKYKNSIDRKLTLAFIKILSLRFILLIISGIIPMKYGVPLAFFSIIISWVLPGTLEKLMVYRPINFPHLLERLTLLIIITFGEMIINISSYFKLENLTIYSIFIFITVCALFMTYITQFDHWIDEKRENESGIFLIYLHYPIIFGISLLTVAFDFAISSVKSIYALIVLYYFGLLLFYIGIFMADKYNKSGFVKSKHVIFTHVITWICGLTIAFLLKDVKSLITIAMIVVCINSYVSSKDMLSKLEHQKNV